MKAAGVVLATAVALALQTTLAQFVSRGSVGVDFVIVVVVYAALAAGPGTGLLAGTFAGLLQDTLASGEVVGIGGLAMSIVGFLAGIIGTQFIVAQPLTRFVVFFGATVLYRSIYVGLYGLLGLRDFGLPLAAIAGQALGSAIVGVVAFEVAEFLPGAMERRRAARGRIRR
jgi:rod shape-determining protein MreD